MSEHVTLSLRAPLDSRIDLECVAPDRFAQSSEAEIAGVPVWAGRDEHRIGDYFHVRGERSASVRIVGDVRRAHRIGAGLTTGTIEIIGDAGNDLGVGMSGGSIHLRGNAGDRVGAGGPGASRGMTGGEIVVEGSVGDDAGARMRRGLLFVGGHAGATAARAIIAGTVMVRGRVGAEPALGNKRGTLVVSGDVDIPVTYRYACRYQPPHVRLVLTYLRRRYDVAVDDRMSDGMFDRYCGDAGTVAKGEILQWVRE